MSVIAGVRFVTFLEDWGDIRFLPVVRNLAYSIGEISVGGIVYGLAAL